MLHLRCTALLVSDEYILDNAVDHVFGCFFFWGLNAIAWIIKAVDCPPPCLSCNTAQDCGVL